MGYCVYTSLNDAEKLQADIDAAHGWPKVGEGVCQRVHVGGGLHVNHPFCCTTHHVSVRKHPDKDEWAVQLTDAESKAAAGVKPEVELTADWDKDPTRT